MHSLELQEVFDYYIANHRIEVTAWVPCFECDVCRHREESIGARELRNEAVKEAIDKFWKKMLAGFMGDGPLDITRSIFRSAFDKLGGKQKGKVAEEFGRWLLGQSYE